MAEQQLESPLAIIAGSGALPPLIAEAAAAQGRTPVIFAIAGEAAPESFQHARTHVVRWGEIGRFLRLIEAERCDQAIFVGSIARRPDFKSIRPDFGAVRLMPRILGLMRRGDDSLLSGVAEIFREHGVRLSSPLDVAPHLALPEGLVCGQLSSHSVEGIEKASEAARLIGHLDIGQAAVAIRGRIVAAEDAGGTEDLLQRVRHLRARGRISGGGGVLVKCMKPQQDSRLDLPTIGPATAEQARQAGLEGVAGEAGRTLLVGREQTIEAFRHEGLFLFGIRPLPSIGNG